MNPSIAYIGSTPPPTDAKVTLLNPNSGAVLFTGQFGDAQAWAEKNSGLVFLVAHEGTAHASAHFGRLFRSETEFLAAVAARASDFSKGFGALRYEAKCNKAGVAVTYDDASFQRGDGVLYAYDPQTYEMCAVLPGQTTIPGWIHVRVDDDHECAVVHV